MSPARNPGRVVGFWYLLSYWAAAAPHHIPNKLFVHGDAAATASTSPRTNGSSDSAC